jgi:hypothetical protein
MCVGDITTRLEVCQRIEVLYARHSQFRNLSLIQHDSHYYETSEGGKRAVARGMMELKS